MKRKSQKARAADSMREALRILERGTSTDFRDLGPLDGESPLNVFYASGAAQAAIKNALKVIEGRS